jgi:hypothetical protein
MRQAKIYVFLPVAMVPGDMVALARLGADGPASRDVLRNEGGPNYLPRLNDARKKYAPKRNDFVVKTSLSCRGRRIS